MPSSPNTPSSDQGQSTRSEAASKPGSLLEKLDALSASTPTTSLGTSSGSYKLATASSISTDRSGFPASPVTPTPTGMAQSKQVPSGVSTSDPSTVSTIDLTIPFVSDPDRDGVVTAAAINTPPARRSSDTEETTIRALPAAVPSRSRSVTPSSSRIRQSRGQSVPIYHLIGSPISPSPSPRGSHFRSSLASELQARRLRTSDTGSSDDSELIVESIVGSSTRRTRARSVSVRCQTPSSAARMNGSSRQTIAPSTAGRHSSDEDADSDFCVAGVVKAEHAAQSLNVDDVSSDGGQPPTAPSLARQRLGSMGPPTAPPASMVAVSTNTLASAIAQRVRETRNLPSPSPGPALGATTRLRLGRLRSLTPYVRRAPLTPTELAARTATAAAASSVSSRLSEDRGSGRATRSRSQSRGPLDPDFAASPLSRSRSQTPGPSTSVNARRNITPEPEFDPSWILENVRRARSAVRTHQDARTSAQNAAAAGSPSRTMSIDLTVDDAGMDIDGNDNDECEQVPRHADDGRRHNARDHDGFADVDEIEAFYSRNSRPPSQRYSTPQPLRQPAQRRFSTPGPSMPATSSAFQRRVRHTSDGHAD